MAVLSGKDGTVTWNSGVITHCTGWRCTETSNNSAWASNNTGGYKFRVGGTKDWSGSFDAKYDTTIAPTVGQGTMTGTPVSLVLTAGANETLTGNAIIDNIDLDVNVDSGDVIGYRVNFSGSGILTRT